jgi:hypothetical protein
MTNVMPRTGMPGAHLSTNTVAMMLLKPSDPLRPRAPGQGSSDVQERTAGRAPFPENGRQACLETHRHSATARARPVEH